MRYFLELCLKSVQASLEHLDAEIIVVDNNSSDDSCQMLETLFPEIKLIKNSENIGFSKANNQGVKAAQGDYVCILNPDTVVAEDTFVQLIKFANEAKDLGTLGCQLIDGTGAYLPESKRNIPLIRVAAQKMLGNTRNYYANHLSKDEVGKVDVLVGAFMMFNRNTYLEVGGFDEDYFMYGEDIDLSYRLLKSGYSNYYYGKTSIIHYKGESTLKDRSYAKRFYGAMQLFYKKHFSSNFLFDLAVWFGLQVAFLVRRKPKSSSFEATNYLFVSNVARKALQALYGDNLKQISKLDGVPPHSEVIFNADDNSYKSIINAMEFWNAVTDIKFKILPNDSSFIIGSDDSINRGEIIVFKEE